MSIISKIVKRGYKISKQLNIPQPNKIKQQQVVLRKLLERAMFTEFGKKYNFEKIVLARDIESKFREEVPVHNYSDIKYWWERARAGERNISWPGRIKYFALSSGTSDQGTKYIPVSTAMLRAMKRAGIRQFLSVSRAQKQPLDFVTHHSLMLGGSTDLNYDGVAYSGDLSGITTGRQPFWIRPSSKPESHIMAKKTWGEKIEAILEAAPGWDVGAVAAVPAWTQIIFEKIIEKYKLKTIHDIWPNLSAFIYGGVAITPYRKSLERLFGKPVMFFETYLASEGFFAFQNKPNSKGMRLFLNNGVYFEFVPFDKYNFDDNYDLKPDARVLKLADVKVGEEYALLISTVAGTWRYLIGDTIRFVSLRHYEIVITGRTKHFLSLCGEHLSVDNMNMAIDLLSDEFGTEINEYTVIGAPYEGLFCHEWFIGTDKELDPARVRKSLDENLAALNDDYAVERRHGLKEVFVTLLPNSYFNEFLKRRGKEGGQTKFPRVMKGQIVDDWYDFLENKKMKHARQLRTEPQLH
jgi:hypothetical protein